MSCKLTKETFSEKVVQVVKSGKAFEKLKIVSTMNVQSAKILSYKDKKVLFVPYDANNPSPNQLYGAIEGVKRQINAFYKTPIAHVNHTLTSGKELVIQPSQEFIDGFNLALEIAEQKVLEEEFGSRYNEPKINKPLGDNFLELINYKALQLESIEKDIIRAKRNLKVRGLSPQEAKRREDMLNNMEFERQRILNHLDLLSKKEEGLMFGAIVEDLDQMEKALRSKELYDVNKVKERLEWYQEFAVSIENKNHPAASTVTLRITKLTSDMRTLLKEKLKILLEENDKIREVLKNLSETEERQITIDDLLIANKDISAVDREIFGLISSTTGDTILPEFLQNLTRSEVLKRQTEIENLIDQLETLEHADPTLLNPEWIFSKENEGFLIDVFSKKWFGQLGARAKLLTTFSDTLKNKLDPKAPYTKIINWYEKNTEIINIFKIPAIKNLYGADPAYAKYFTFTDAEMEVYDKNLKDKLGPRYGDIMNDTLNNLRKFEEHKASAVTQYGAYADRNIAQNNIWEFIHLYHKHRGKNVPKILYEYGTNKTLAEVYFSNFTGLPMIPKVRVNTLTQTEFGPQYVEQDSGYFSEEFKDIKEDSNKVALWEIYKEMAGYINDTYNLGYTAIYWPKLKEELAESILKNMRFIRDNPLAVGQKSLTMLSDIYASYRSEWFEKGEYSPTSDIVSNYSDTSKKEIIDLASVYQLKGMSPTEAMKLATKNVLKSYSKDISRNFKAALIEASIHNARLEMEPIAEIVLDKYADIKDAEGLTRENGIARLEAYIDKVIKNKTSVSRGKGDVLGANLSKKSAAKVILQAFKKDTDLDVEALKFYTPQEKILLQELKELLKEKERAPKSQLFEEKGFSLAKDFAINEDGEIDTLDYYFNGEPITLEEYDEKYREYLVMRINKVGLDSNLHGIINGILKTTIITSLGFWNVPAGIFNRIEGQHTAWIMDAYGEFWTTGNLDEANDFLNYYISGHKLLNKKVSFLSDEKLEQYEIFEALTKRFSMLQDRKNELQRNTSEGKFDTNKLNMFKFAVEYPEAKTQGSILLSILMDHQIKDDDGVSYPFFDKETQTFTAFNLVNGVLVLKDNFKRKQGFHLETQEMIDLVIKSENAISHSQGNYNVWDNVKLKNNIIGQTASLFKSWWPEHFSATWGLRTTQKGENKEFNVNLSTKRQKYQGTYISAMSGNKLAFAAYMSGMLGLSYGLSWVVLALGGTVFTAGLVTAALRGNLKVNSFTIGKDLRNIADLANFMKAVLLEVPNYPSTMLLDRRIIKADPLANSKIMTKEEMAALKSLARRLAVMLWMVSIKLVVGALLYDDDDDEDSDRMRYYYKIQNELTKAANALSSFTDPYALASDLSRNAAVSKLTHIYKLCQYSFTAQADGQKAMKHLAGVFLPKEANKLLVQGLNPLQDNTLYDESIFNATSPNFKWIADGVKDRATGGEYLKEKDIRNYRKEAREDVKAILVDVISNEDELEALTNAIIKSKYGTKERGSTVAQEYERILQARKIPFAFTDEYKVVLKEKGFSDRKIRRIEKAVNR